jgi:hypothetical protein
VQLYPGDLVYGVIIPRTVRLSEAPGFGQPITAYDPRSRGAAAYRELAREVALRPPPEAPMPSFDDLAVAVTIEAPPNGSAGVAARPADAAAVVDEEPEVEEPDLEESEVEEPDLEESDLVQLEEPLEEGPTPGAPGSAGAPGAPIDGGEPEAERPSLREKSVDERGRRPDASSPTQAHVDVASTPPPTPSAPPPAADEELWVEPPPEPEPRVKRPSRPAAPGELPERRVVVIDEDQEIDIRSGQEAPPPPPASDEGTGTTEIGATLEEEPGRKRRWRMFRRGGDR